MTSNADKYPRLLVISNNSFSKTSNNGKTLASFFDKYPLGKIAQLYFYPEIPNHSYFNNYYRVTDSDVVKSLFKNSKCGGKIIIKADNHCYDSKSGHFNFLRQLKKYDAFRITRELIWKRKTWNTKEFNSWLEDFSPEVIFLCAGDSGFAYDITGYIRRGYNTKLITYITDDYILPRKTISLPWWIRRNYIIKKMSVAVKESDLFITISSQMREVYKEIFGKDSMLAINATDSMKGSYVIQKDNITTFVYTGGLHYKRYKTLNLLAKSIKRFNTNEQNKKKAYLEIYSSQVPSKSILKDLNIEGASKFCGKLNSVELRQVLNTRDILVHVESFEHKSIESTRLSISTKIPEYLSTGKPVLAIGPSGIASMEYLKDCAYCITEKEKIEDGIFSLLNDEELIKSIMISAEQKYLINHDKNQFVNKLINRIIEISTN